MVADRAVVAHDEAQQAYEDEIRFLHGPDDLGKNPRQRRIPLFSLVN